MRVAILAFAAGVALLQTQASLPGARIFFCLALLALFAGGAARCGNAALRRLGAVVFCVSAGFAWAGFLATSRLADELPHAWEGREVELIGVVAALPQRFDRGERFEVDVDTVLTPGAVVPSHVVLSWYHGWEEREEGDEGDRDESDQARPAGFDGAARALRPGERWRLTARFKRPHGLANPHAFDYEAWLFERGIRATGNVRVKARHERLENFVVTPRYVVERWRETIRSRFFRAMPEAPYLGVLVALAIGDQRAIPNAQWQVFNRTGITHLVSISGLHVTMVAALFASLAGWLWRRSESLLLAVPAQQAAVAVGWLAALAYALLAGFEVPAQRTLYMLSVVALALWSRRNFSVGRTLLVALFVVLVLDPWAVLATGFWLSFGAVALLLYVGSARIGRAPDWRERLRLWGAAQWAVTVGSVPLLLFFFQQFSLVSPLANAIAIPLVSFVVTPLSLLFSLLPWPPLLHLDHFVLAQLMRLLEALADWPVWQQPAPPLAATLVALVGVAWLLLPRGFPARAIGLVLLLPALFLRPPQPVEGEAWVDVLDVGQGLAVLVRTARHSLVYDTGPLYGAGTSAGSRVVVPYLRAVGVEALDALVVSHQDKDHAGGVDALRESVPIAKILSSLADFPGEACADGVDWHWDGVHFSLLHPLPGDYAVAGKKPNSLSCVLKIATSGSSVLLTGDIEAVDERALVARAASRLASEVLVVPHHGGAASSSPEFIAAVGAHEAVFSAGYRNAFRHPRPEVRARYADARQWRTDHDGAICIVIGATSAISGWRGERRRYWLDDFAAASAAEAPASSARLAR